MDTSQTPVFDIFGPIVESPISIYVTHEYTEFVGNTVASRRDIVPVAPYFSQLNAQVEQIKKLYTDAGGVFITSSASLNYLTLRFKIQEGKSYAVNMLIALATKSVALSKGIYFNVTIEPYPMRNAVSALTAHPELTPAFGMKVNEPVWVFNDKGESVPGIISEVSMTTDGAVAAKKDDLTSQIISGVTHYFAAGQLIVMSAYVYVLDFIIDKWLGGSSMLGPSTPQYYLINLYKIELINGSFVYATDGGERQDLHTIPHIVRRSIPSDFSTSLAKVKQVATDPQLPIIMERYKLSLTNEQKDLVDKALAIKLQAAINAKVKENIITQQNITNTYAVPIPIIDTKLLPSPTTVVKKVILQKPIAGQQNQSTLLQGSNEQTILLIGAGILFILLIY